MNGNIIYVIVACLIEYLIVRAAYSIGRGKGYLEGRDYMSKRWSSFVRIACGEEFIKENRYHLNKLNYQPIDKDHS